MIKNIFYKSLFILILTSALMFIGILFTVQYNNIKYSQVMIMNIMEMLENEIDIYDMKTEEDFRKFVLQSDKKDLRISVIATNGIVIADTTTNIALSPMANHTNRSDVIEALHSSGDKTVFSIHTSASQKIPYIYASKKINTKDNIDYILRISMPMDSVNKYLITFLFTAVMVIGIVIIIMALVLPSTAKSIMIPFYSIKETLDNIYKNKSQNIKNLTGFNDINDILYDINELAIDLNNNIIGYQTEREKLNYVLENIAQGIVAINKNKDIFFINQFALELLNSTDSDIKSLNEIIKDKSVIKKIEDAIKLNRFSKFDIKERNMDIEINVIPILNNKNISALIKFEDVTDIRKVEIEKQDFFINASHELKTPLTSILGYSELLINMSAKDKNENKKTDFIKRINAEALRMKELVLNMLTLSRMEANWQETIDEKIDLKDIILNVFESNKIKSQKRNINIELYIESAIIIANKEKITEVVNNLVDNAIKYTDDGGEIKIILKNNKDKAIFTVKDNGCGIESKYLNRIFERFFRVKNEKYLKVQGTGLGLTIVKNICAHYNADIYINSEENKGTEISVVFNL
ncbi:sensor histidine kinase [Brachyspira aalborgi]|jgi:two-component system phosphate regulon sensor histidine kinase PhoR|uniref:histidine kinase n=1 Tax=Brachyspira aalborgi TaxID=29522 RepID=A0AB38Q4G9_9SPIR|nr:HAMP domain-containing sensor histidine kinase [Brachyspira aalborgi]MBS4762627.1 two-component sensor histidine kinase [Brachyspira sp.]CCY77258.1 signal transduction histidine kinase [Brachyspira sp. CAG:700]TXJ28665.1 two-component sensor histidine kinase [Brachyspira aalborgi]TXJ34581.1 two-component sensor histidine kinase [Brachyspira aalborgi]TXJ46051.1 two-component sensor histidine kinase [Brachyspira aalborgi]